MVWCCVFVFGVMIWYVDVVVGIVNKFMIVIERCDVVDFVLGWEEVRWDDSCVEEVGMGF